MNKNAIKKFAIDTRNKLIASVTDKAGMLGITPDNCSEAITKGADFEVYKTAAGTELTLNKKQCEQRRKLVDQIHARGFEAVVEEVAYTWFNRICAIRFMEVNDYMYPVRVRVLSSEKEGKNEPDVVTMAPEIDWNFTDKEREEIIDAKMNNRLDDLFRMLFIKQCNLLHEVLPGLFEETEDYTEMLLNISFTNEDDVIRMLVDEKRGIPEEDFNVNTIGEDGQPTGQVEIIGWLYQYYNTELKDDTFAKLKKNVKITKERIPAATQLFTPDWIVRYMVENSVGRTWIEHLRAANPGIDEKAAAERFGWKYYLPEAEQEEAVNVKLAEIRTTYKDLKPTDITCIDPCMGSGHILIAMFDVLMDIYESAGYDKREAAFDIVEHNIYGLEIDQRAYQLAYFAVMMKGRGYNRRFLTNMAEKKIEPNIYVFEESTSINFDHLNYFGNMLEPIKRNKIQSQLLELLNTFKDAKKYGIVLKIPSYYWDDFDIYISDLKVDDQISFSTINIDATQNNIKKIIEIARVMSKSYDVVVTNPPYMSASGMDPSLASYVKNEYPNSKSDLFAVCIEKGNLMTNKYGFNCMVTMQSWMFLSSYDKFRENIIDNYTIYSLMHMENMVMGIAFGTSATIFRKIKLQNFLGTYNSIKLKDIVNGKPEQFPILNNYYKNICSEKFKLIPTMPIAYWADKQLFKIFENKCISDIADVKTGLQTGNNGKYLRLWHEVEYSSIDFEASQESSFDKKWYPHTKGGNYRKWYGNLDYVINWENDGMEIKAEKGSVIRSPQMYFKEGITWSHTTSGGFSGRQLPAHCIINVESPSIYNCDKPFYIMGLLNSLVGELIFQTMNSTMHYLVGNVSKVPVIVDEKELNIVNRLVKECIDISKDDWDERETSWGFKKNKLVARAKNESSHTLKFYVDEQIRECENRYNTVFANEVRLSELFAKIYNVNISNKIERENITLYCGNEKTEIERLLSYFVGCVFGRYNFANDGVQSNIENNPQYILLNNSLNKTNDVIELLNKWLSNVFGKEYVAENMEYIATVLRSKGDTAEDKIRNYFMNEFYKYHCNDYSITGSGERPLYWLFSSGKKGALKVLIYSHNYNKDLVGKIRVECLHSTQKFLENLFNTFEYELNNTTSTGNKGMLKKQMELIRQQQQELMIYDEAITHVANMRIGINLDDGVRYNYNLFQNVVISHKGTKPVKMDLLENIK